MSKCNVIIRAYNAIKCKCKCYATIRKYNEYIKFHNKRLSKVQLICGFSIDGLDKNCKKNDLEKLQGIKHAVYIIEHDNCEEIRDKVQKSYNKYRKNEENKSPPKMCALINDKHPSTNIMYVGVSATLLTRIKQHTISDTTPSALRLYGWFPKGHTYKITVLVYEDSDTAEFVESVIWHALRPAFGKSGGNNK